MRTRVLTNIMLLVSLLLAATETRAGEPVLSATGYGAIKFGSKLSEVETTMAEHVAPPVDKDEAACRYVDFKAYPEAQFMVEQGVVTRADVSANAKNNLNITFGARVEKVKAEFPLVQIKPDNYYPDGHYLIFKSTDGKAAIVMEEAFGVIAAIRGGLEPSVEYIEGCL